MDETEKKIDANFFHLVLSLQMAAMQQMGKIASPISGKVEKNLEQARLSIDMLSMIAQKTAGNLTNEEKNLMDRVLFECRMNYVDETNKADAEKKEEGKAPAESEPEKKSEDSEKS